MKTELAATQGEVQTLLKVGIIREQEVQDRNAVLWNYSEAGLHLQVRDIVLPFRVKVWCSDSFMEVMRLPIPKPSVKWQCCIGT
jgi:hypothetical protein